MFVFSNTFIVLLPFAAYSLWLAACEERVKRKIKEKREEREIWRKCGKWKCFIKLKNRKKPYPQPLPRREGSGMNRLLITNNSVGLWSSAGNNQTCFIKSYYSPPYGGGAGGGALGFLLY